MKIRLWFLLSLSVGVISWLYATKVLYPWQEWGRTHHPGLKAQMWDLYPRWVGARELLLHGRNPYGPEVSHEIQMGFYGHIITQDYNDTAHKMIDEQRFAYPVFVVFLMAPFIYLDFNEILRWAPVVLGLLAALCVPLCLDILRWRLPATAVAAITLFTGSSPQIVEGMHHQQLAVFVGLALVAGAWCTCRGHLASAGALLAWSTIKPQMAFFPLCFFLMWVIGDWSKRWKLLTGFLVMLAILFGAGELILPGWIGYFVEGAAAYRKYFPTTSILRMVVGDTLGEILGSIIVLGLLVYAWRNRRETADSPQFATVFAAFLMGTILAFPLLTSFNQILLILPTLLILREWQTLPRFSRIIFTICVSWLWIISLALLLFTPRLDSAGQWPLLPLLPVSFFPLLLTVVFITRRTNLTPQRLGATDLRLT
jgi:hypothetical protein